MKLITPFALPHAEEIVLVPVVLGPCHLSRATTPEAKPTRVLKPSSLALEPNTLRGRRGNNTHVPMQTVLDAIRHSQLAEERRAALDASKAEAARRGYASVLDEQRMLRHARQAALRQQDALSGAEAARLRNAQAALEYMDAHRRATERKAAIEADKAAAARRQLQMAQHALASLTAAKLQREQEQVAAAAAASQRASRPAPASSDLMHLAAIQRQLHALRAKAATKISAAYRGHRTRTLLALYDLIRTMLAPRAAHADKARAALKEASKPAGAGRSAGVDGPSQPRATEPTTTAPTPPAAAGAAAPSEVDVAAVPPLPASTPAAPAAPAKPSNAPEPLSLADELSGLEDAVAHALVDHVVPLRSAAAAKPPTALAVRAASEALMSQLLKLDALAERPGAAALRDRRKALGRLLVKNLDALDALAAQLAPPELPELPEPHAQAAQSDAQPAAADLSLEAQQVAEQATTAMDAQPPALEPKQVDLNAQRQPCVASPVAEASGTAVQEPEPRAEAAEAEVEAGASPKSEQLAPAVEAASAAAATIASPAQQHPGSAMVEAHPEEAAEDAGEEQEHEKMPSPDLLAAAAQEAQQPAAEAKVETKSEEEEASKAAAEPTAGEGAPHEKPHSNKAEEDQQQTQQTQQPSEQPGEQPAAHEEKPMGERQSSDGFVMIGDDDEAGGEAGGEQAACEDTVSSVEASVRAKPRIAITPPVEGAAGVDGKQSVPHPPAAPDQAHGAEDEEARSAAAGNPEAGVEGTHEEEEHVPLRLPQRVAAESGWRETAEHLAATLKKLELENSALRQQLERVHLRADTQPKAAVLV